MLSFLHFEKISSLRGKYLLILLPSLLTCFFIISLLFAIFSYEDKQQEIISKLENYAKTQANILAKPLWEMNLHIAQAQLESMLLIPEFCGVVINEFTTDKKLQAGIIPTHTATKQFFSIKTDINYKIAENSEHIGNLLIVAPKSFIYKSLIHTLLRDTLLLLFLITAIIISNIVANHLIIGKPLNRFLMAIRRAGIEKISEPVAWSSNDEMGEVIHAYNELLKTLKTSEEALKKSEARFRTLVETSSDWIWEVDQKGLFTYSSPRVKELLGYEPAALIGTSLFDLVVDEDQKRIQTYVTTALSDKAIIDTLENSKCHKDGQSIVLEMNALPILDKGGHIRGYRGVERDISLRKQTQEMIIQSEKVISVGEMAAGMAHEINNPLAGIMQNTQVLENRLQPGLPKNRRIADECGINIDKLNAYLDKRGILAILTAITQSGRRAAAIVRNMLDFTRKSESQFSEVNINELLNRSIELAQHDYDLEKKYDFRQINIIRKYDSTIPEIECDENTLQQVFFNLLKNGSQAMSEVEDREPQFTLSTRQDNKNVTIEIEDNGPGMDQHTKSRVFEAFYTTKKAGYGTGLGLSVAYYIISENHKGRIEVESEPGQGTKFIIKLPLKRHMPEQKKCFK